MHALSGRVGEKVFFEKNEKKKKRYNIYFLKNR